MGPLPKEKFSCVRPAYNVFLSLSQEGRDRVFTDDTTPMAANMVMMDDPP